MNKKPELVSSLTGAAAGVLLTIGMAAQAAELPSTMAWSSYDVGSAGYAEASAMADAMGRQFDVRVRIMPSGSSIGRLTPVVTGRADYGFLATETFFAVEGVHDFADRRWGPQDLRTLAGRPSAFGIPTARDANIRAVDDLRGKRVAFVAGNPSVNVKCDGMLAFGDLTRDDVDAIMFPTYAAAMSSLAEGRADATCTTTTPSQMYELAESPRGIYWVPIPPEDKEGWARVEAIAPFYAPYQETVGAGISEDNPAQIMAYRYPVLVTQASKSADDVYAFMQALHESFDLYKNATAVMPRWKLDAAGVPSIDAPFHEGAIRFLREIGVWQEQHDAWNDRALKRLQALRSAWDDAMAEGSDLSDEEFAKLWEERRQETLANL